MRALKTQENDRLDYKDADGNDVSRIETFLTRIDSLLEPYLQSQETLAGLSADDELYDGYTALSERSKEMLESTLDRAIDVLTGEEELY